MAKYPTNIIDLLKNFTETQLGMTINIITYAKSSEGNYTIIVDDLYYLQETFTISIGGNDYYIQEIIQNRQMLKLTGSADITETSFSIYPLYFYYGTILETQAQIKYIPDQADRTPMVYLLLDPEQKWNMWTDAWERKINVKIYFLTQSDYTITRPDLEEKVIKSMQRLVYVFMQRLRLEPYIIDDELVNNYTTKDYPKFGRYTLESGAEKILLTDQFSGVGLDLNFTISKQAYCE